MGKPTDDPIYVNLHLPMNLATQGVVVELQGGRMRIYNRCIQ